jgi:CRP-like cAMP-binding protein
MPDFNATQPVYCNKLLAALPVGDIERLRQHLHRVPLVLEQVLHEVGHPLENVYFVEDGLVSLTANTGDNGLVEVGMTGREGLVGTAALLSPHSHAIHRALVQIGGSAWRMQSAVLREMMEQSPALRDRCFRYLQVVMAQTSQSAACNARHALPERLARWLLMSRDRADGDTIPMTQEFLSYMLGVRRAGVSIAVTALHARGLIQQSRGHMTILDRVGLEQQSCTCYRLIEDSRKQIMSAFQQP